MIFVAKVSFHSTTTFHKITDGKAWPVVILEARGNNHAVVAHDISNFSHNGTMKVKNSLAGETVFDRVQLAEHDVECRVTNKSNDWNLAHMTCFYIEFRCHADSVWPPPRPRPLLDLAPPSRPEYRPYRQPPLYTDWS